MADQMPSVGRIVHYQPYGVQGSEHLPDPVEAIITAIPAPDSTSEATATTVSLYVIYPYGTNTIALVPFSPEPRPGYWNWPPRV